MPIILVCKKQGRETRASLGYIISSSMKPYLKKRKERRRGRSDWFAKYMWLLWIQIQPAIKYEEKLHWTCIFLIIS